MKPRSSTKDAAFVRDSLEDEQIGEVHSRNPEFVFGSGRPRTATRVISLGEEIHLHYSLYRNYLHAYDRAHDATTTTAVGSDRSGCGPRGACCSHGNRSLRLH